MRGPRRVLAGGCGAASRRPTHRRSSGGSLPGSTPEAFFRAWLEHGTGGTCWSGNGALYALLKALGFSAERGIATMMVSPDTTPNHGTVVVTLDGARFIVDASILTGEPLRLPEPAATGAAPEPAPIPRIDVRDGTAYIVWRTPRAPEGFLCRIDRIGVGDEEWDARHQATGGWGPFNFSVAARVNRGRGSIAYGAGMRYAFDEAGVLTSQPVDRAGRDRFLVEELGIAETLVRALPDDRPVPPPP
jgi:N-hydroxyarylamine O-acetyltransferase